MKRFFAMVRDVIGQDNNSIERNLTLMMFSVVAIFIFCSTVSCFIYILYWFDVIDLLTFLILRPIDIFLLTINSSVNIFLYVCFCKPFRENLMAIFPWIKVKKNQEKVTWKDSSSNPIHTADTKIMLKETQCED